MKIIVIGATHAGTFATQQILTTHPTDQVVVYERNDNLSFLSCGIALWVGDHVSDPSKMFYATPEDLTKLGADMRMGHNVQAVDADNKTVTVQNLQTGEQFTDAYDKLVFTPGSAPITPPIAGIDDPRIYYCKDYADAQRLKAITPTINSAVVIGAGYIGAEIAEQFALAGKKVTLIDALDRALAKNFDPEITDQIETAYQKHGTTLALGQKVERFDGGEQITVTTDAGQYSADIAVLAIGFRPHTELLKGQVDMLPNGAIVTDAYMQASRPEILVAGDAAAVHFNPTGKPDYIPLATNAVRQGVLVGDNIHGANVQYVGTQATSAVALFGYTMATTGLTVAGGKARGLNLVSTTITEAYRPEFMLTTTPVTATLVWEPVSRQIKGAAFFSKHDVSMSANLVSLAIQTGQTIDQLAMLDTFFQPNFDQPINWVNKVAMQAVALS
ncbi:FAD-dependent oxidoreductase [Lacticaseibacillus sp. N501-2]|uniref:FAD-dependent oxidoreductase n=1 Tax=Lacticaseibacillus salsurae TaxID=3367729 RepID=UPI0038B2BEA9